MKKVIFLFSTILFFHVSFAQQRALKANGTATTKIISTEAKDGEVKILDLDGVAIFVKKGKSWYFGGERNTAIISRVINTNNKKVYLKFEYIDGGENKNDGGRFYVSDASTGGRCLICHGYSRLLPLNIYDNPDSEECKEVSVGMEFEIQNLNSIKVIGAKVLDKIGF